MAKVTLHPMVLGISGKVGSLVFYSYGNTQYVRRYVIPKNPNTPAQKSRRELFADAVNKWQSLPEQKKNRWNNDARNQSVSGYNLFISCYLNSVKPSGNETAGINIPSYQIRSLSVYDSGCLLLDNNHDTASQTFHLTTHRIESQAYR